MKTLPTTPVATGPSRRHVLGMLPLALAWGHTSAHAEGESRYEKIRASGTLKVAIYKDNAPYSDGPNNDISGVDVSLAHALAHELNLKVALLPFDAGERMDDDLRNMVWRGHYLGYGPADVMLHVPVDKFLIRETPQALIFAPYARETLVVFHNKEKIPTVSSGNDLIDQPLGAERGSGAAGTLLGYQGGSLRSQVKMFNSGLQAAEAVINGQVSAAYISRAQAEAALFATKAPTGRFGLQQLSLPGLADNGWPIGMAVKADNKELATALEQALQNLRAKGEFISLFRERGLTLVAP